VDGCGAPHHEARRGHGRGRAGDRRQGVRLRAGGEAIPPLRDWPVRCLMPSPRGRFPEHLHFDRRVDFVTPRTWPTGRAGRARPSRLSCMDGVREFLRRSVQADGDAQPEPA
jgi:hypothetical protein